MRNPWMSMWLSGANAWAGAMRGFWAAEMHRQQTQMTSEMMNQMIRFWTGAWMLAPQTVAERTAAPSMSVVIGGKGKRTH
jgi:hypothetical protein